LPQNNTGAPIKKKRNFSAEFKRESAQLVIDQNYTVAEAAKPMDIGLSAMTRWVNSCVHFATMGSICSFLWKNRKWRSFKITESKGACSTAVESWQ